MIRSKREILRKRRHSRISISAIVRVDLIIFFAASDISIRLQKKK